MVIGLATRSDGIDDKPRHDTAGYTQQAGRDEYFDTLQQRYAKKKEVAEKYLVVQMGLSAFVWDAARGDFCAHTWNVHVFPSDMVRGRRARVRHAVLYCACD